MSSPSGAARPLDVSSAWPRPLVLASASPRRRDLLARLGRSFTVEAADLDESALPDETPQAHGRRLAEAKARAAAEALLARGELLPGSLFLGADTLVLDGPEILGKPADAREAVSMLRRLSGRRHLVQTALALVEPDSGRTLADLALTVVWMRAFSGAEIEAYVESGDPLDKAGAYAIQHRAFRPVARLEGAETTVIGLPLALTARLLARFEDL